MFFVMRLLLLINKLNKMKSRTILPKKKMKAIENVLKVETPNHDLTNLFINSYQILPVLIFLSFYYFLYVPHKSNKWDKNNRTYEVFRSTRQMNIESSALIGCWLIFLIINIKFKDTFYENSNSELLISKLNPLSLCQHTNAILASISC